MLRLLARHGEHYRCHAMRRPEARATLALEARFCARPDLLMRAVRDGRVSLPEAVG